MHKEKTLLCDKCDFATNENYLLKRHIDAVHLKKFACQVGLPNVRIEVFLSMKNVDAHPRNYIFVIVCIRPL